jgi:hypothetical protein
MMIMNKSGSREEPQCRATQGEKRRLRRVKKLRVVVLGC